MDRVLRYDDRASDRDWADVLTTFTLFAGVNKRHLRKLVRQASFSELARGESVLLNGLATDAFYVVLGGEAKILRPARRSIRTGDYFGELGVLGGDPRPLHVVATQELHLMKLPRRPVIELARRHQRVTLTLLKEIGARLQPARVA
jgi:CRP-like cAMP-binding protein